MLSQLGGLLLRAPPPRRTLHSVRLLAERVKPELITLGAPVHNVVLGAPLELLLPEFDAALDLDLVHAAVLFLSLDVICWLEQTIMRVELLYVGVPHWSFRLPDFRHFNYFICFALGMHRTEALCGGRAYIELLARTHPQFELLEAPLVDHVFTGARLHLGHVSIFVEDGRVRAVGVVHAQNTVPPGFRNQALPSAQEPLLLIVLLHLHKLVSQLFDLFAGG